jgi:hypothetical protein
MCLIVGMVELLRMAVVRRAFRLERTMRSERIWLWMQGSQGELALRSLNVHCYALLANFASLCPRVHLNSCRSLE